MARACRSIPHYSPRRTKDENEGQFFERQAEEPERQKEAASGNRRQAGRGCCSGDPSLPRRRQIQIGRPIQYR